MNTREYMSNKIRELRIERGIKQSELGAMLSEPKKGATISSWEKARTMPNETDLLDLCELFNVDLYDFYPPKARKEEPTLTADEQKLITLYRKLPANGKHAVIAGLEDFASRYKEKG